MKLVLRPSRRGTDCAAFEKRMKKAIASGVVLDACQNSMRIRKVTTEDLFPLASQVDSGVAELIRKQEAGWSYIQSGRATSQTSRCRSGLPLGCRVRNAPFDHGDLDRVVDY